MPLFSGLDAVYLLCSVQALFVVGLLLARRQNRTANRFLALAIGTIGVGSVYMLYLRSGLYLSDPRWLFIIDPLAALYGPLFYLYTRALTARPVPRRQAAAHLAFFTLYALSTVPRMLLPGEQKIALAHQEVARVMTWDQFFWQWGSEIQGLVYLIASLRELRRYRAQLVQERSNTERLSLRWLQGLMGTLLVLWIGSMCGRISPFPVLGYVHIGLLALIYAIAYVNAVQPQIFASELASPAAPAAPAPWPPADAASSPGPALAAAPPSAAPAPPEPALPAPAQASLAAPADAASAEAPPAEALPAEAFSGMASPAEVPPPAAPASAAPAAAQARAEAEASAAARAEAPVKYQKTRLKEAEVERMASELSALFEREKPYLAPELTLAELAGRLGVAAHHLSQVLNEHFGQSFYDFVNRARVDEVKQRLLAPGASAEKILSIGLECGFNSKSTLNANFKKHTGLTPSQFRERALQQQRTTA